MIEQVYNKSLLIAWVMLYAFAISLIMARKPYHDSENTYLRSKKILATAFALFGIQIMLQWMFDFRGHAPHIATALNITIFHIAAIHFGAAMIILLDHSYRNARQLRFDCICFIANMALLWPSTLLVTGIHRMILQGISAAIFLLVAIRLVLIFFRAYHAAVRKVNNYYSNDVDQFVRWLYKSCLGIIVFGLSEAIICFMPKWVIAIQMTAGDFMFIYIYISFLNYTLNFGLVETAISEEAPAIGNNDADRHANSSEQPSSNLTDEMEQRLKKWIADKGYCKNGVTIDDVANQIYTNRTYISSHINERCGCTFRDWINQLRIEEAKQLMTEHDDMTIQEVALAIGFSSGSHFAQLFSDKEGVTPSKWRRQTPPTVPTAAYSKTDNEVTIQDAKP